MIIKDTDSFLNPENKLDTFSRLSHFIGRGS